MPPGRPDSGISVAADACDDDNDPVVRHLAADSVAIEFGSIATFEISFADRIVRLIAAHPEADQPTIDHFLDDHVALHGSAVLVGSHVVAFLGETGSGKSTFAASMHAAGHRLLGDDAVVISDAGGVFLGESVYPSLRLFRESIDQVFDRSVETSTMAFYSNKLHVAAIDHAELDAGPFPLGAIYFLAANDGPIALDPYFPSDACMALVENSFALDPSDSRSALQRMAEAARVAAVVPCFDLTYPHDFRHLGEARATVLQSLADLSISA